MPALPDNDDRRNDTPRAPCVCTIEANPQDVDAGAELTLTVRVTGLPDGPRGIVVIQDHDGAEVARADLASDEDEEGPQSAIVALAAPRVAAEYIYRAVVLTPEPDGTPRERTSAEVRFAVTPHVTLLNVWDVPSTVVAGDRFKVVVGVKCSAGCCLADRELGIADGEGGVVGTARLGQDVWPGSEGLYFTHAEAQAPSTTGRHHWTVTAGVWDTELPHETGTCELTIRVVSPPDCEVTVETVDREKQMPIEDARVVMHPYRAVTDAHGAARIKVVKGKYDVMVSASRYVPATVTLDVTGDMTTRAELDEDPTWNEDEQDLGY